MPGALEKKIIIGIRDKNKKLVRRSKEKIKAEEYKKIQNFFGEGNKKLFLKLVKNTRKESSTAHFTKIIYRSVDPLLQRIYACA